jgi:hypothetical protein
MERHQQASHFYLSEGGQQKKTGDSQNKQGEVSPV